MEVFPASDDDSLAIIKSVIDDSDYYVLIIGGRYGSTTPEGIGYTEIEYDYASSTGKPILAFLHERPENIPAGKTELSELGRTKLDAFRFKVASAKQVKFWRNSDDLKAKVIQSLSAETKRNPQEGSIRGGNVVDPRRMEQLRNQIEQLQLELVSARQKPPEGANEFSGGNDKFQVRLEKMKYGHVVGYARVKIRWRTIFYEVGPTMYDEASEEQMRDRLSRELSLYSDSITEMDNEDDYSSLRVSEDSFQTIKVQLIALGLINKSLRKRGVADKKTYWSLTPYGEHYLMTLRAIRRTPEATIKSSSDTDPSP